MVTIELASDEQEESQGGGSEPHAVTGDHSFSASQSNENPSENSGHEQVLRSSNAPEDEKNSQPSDSRGTGKNVQHHTNHEADDWETASEGDDDNGADDADASKSGNVNENYEDALTEEEQRQRALLQANAAKAEGNELYAAGKYEEALGCYTTALEAAPDHTSSNETRAMCYCNRAICYLQLKHYEEAIAEGTKALELNPTYIKALLRRAQGQEKLDHLDEAIVDLNKVLELDPGNKQAKDTIRRLEPLAAEKREKMKEEMIGKLKDVGNSILGRFGMNVDNFKAVKDPNTGSYSISFQR